MINIIYVIVSLYVIILEIYKIIFKQKFCFLHTCGKFSELLSRTVKLVHVAFISVQVKKYNDLFLEQLVLLPDCIMWNKYRPGIALHIYTYRNADRGSLNPY